MKILALIRGGIRGVGGALALGFLVVNLNLSVALAHPHHADEPFIHSLGFDHLAQFFGAALVFVLLICLLYSYRGSFFRPKDSDLE